MELEQKLAAVRAILEEHQLEAVRLRGSDWFAWGTCGGSNVVLLTTDTGVAELLIARQGAWVLTDEIEGGRLGEEEVRGLPILACPWTERSSAWDAWVRERAPGRIASDRPAGNEAPLPAALHSLRSTLLAEEIDRYVRLGRDAAEAMTDVLLAARPEWTGFQLAGAAAEALWGRGIEPALVLVAGERRLPVYRHATPSAERLGGRAMAVFCARRHGLFANLTRFVHFRRPDRTECKLHEVVAEVEADVLDAVRPSVSLGQLYEAFIRAYARAGHPGAERGHHQGGTCGYLSRYSIALPGANAVVHPEEAVAFNPSLPGAKIEDTFLVRGKGLEPLTVDARWPTRTVHGRARPAALVR